MNKLSSFEKVFFEKISDLENKLRDREDELRTKDKKILELEAELVTTKATNMCQPEIKQLQITLSMKDVVIENLQLENKLLRSELQSVGIIVQKIQLAVINMNEKEVDPMESSVCMPMSGHVKRVKTRKDQRWFIQ